MITTAMNSAVSGLNAQASRFLHIGNNIANASTTGYKSNDAVFSETLALVGGKGLNGHRLQPGGGVNTLSSVADFSTGQITQDTDDYHIAVNGSGFLPVHLSGQDFVTKAGDFSLIQNPDTGTGGFVMMRPNGAMLQASTTAGGAIPTGAAGVVVFPVAPSSIEIDASGNLVGLPLSVGGLPGPSQPTNSFIGLKNYINPNGLIHEKGQMYIETVEASITNSTNLVVPGTINTGSLRQRALEQSNVDLTEQFTRMIVTQRNFQANAKTITTADEMLQAAINVKR
ncbi:MAG: flagellar hook basal-body protein [Lentisphaeraceae bacterium]|nr:flagellar hook basal-body protein [Lentisphaeraceae bacterium]